MTFLIAIVARSGSLDRVFLGVVGAVARVVAAFAAAITRGLAFASSRVWIQVE